MDSSISRAAQPYQNARKFS
jgi:hypothetical protein